MSLEELGELLLGLELELEPAAELGLDDEEPDAPGVDELDELGLLLLGELIEPDEEPEDDELGEVELGDDGEVERLEPDAPVVEFAPRSQP